MPNLFFVLIKQHSLTRAKQFLNVCLNEMHLYLFSSNHLTNRKVLYLTVKKWGLADYLFFPFVNLRDGVYFGAFRTWCCEMTGFEPVFSAVMKSLKNTLQRFGCPAENLNHPVATCPCFGGGFCFTPCMEFRV